MAIEVGIIMGSKSDFPIMQKAKDILAELGVEAECRVISAHRTPEAAFDYCKSAKDRGLKTIIAGAGGAAHLPGVTAGLTTLPVIGVPINASISTMDGLDSLLSIVQMPSGVPVATVAVDGAKNAGILAAQIVAVAREDVAQKLIEFKATMKTNVEEMDSSIQDV